MPSPVTTEPANTTPYNGNAANVPTDRSTVTLKVTTDAMPPNAASWNYFFQFFADCFQRIFKQAGFLDLASTWTAKQTFGEVELGEGATIPATKTLTLTGATVEDGTLNNPTITGTMTISPWVVGGSSGAGAYGADWSTLGGVPGLNFRKTPWGTLEFYGAVYRAVGAGDVVYTLPEGYRPAEQRVVVASYDNGSGGGTNGLFALRINTDGTVQSLVASAQPSTTHLRLDGISIKL